MPRLNNQNFYVLIIEKQLLLSMSHIIIWSIAILVTAGIIIRPFKLPEAVWAVAGALALMIFQFLSPAEALAGIQKGIDVYLFLIGMMLLAETAREEKLFDWLAAHATRMSKGSSIRLFLLIYLVGTVVTTFLSNDATAVVLTPAVAAAVKTAKVERPLPYLLICAFIANAASFILPISNPANLVIYGNQMPPLMQWLPRYLFPSLLSIVVTYLMLFLSQRKALKQKIETNIFIRELKPGGRLALYGIGFTTLVLLVSSAMNVPLGLPTAIAGIATTFFVLLKTRQTPKKIFKGVSWSVLPLVAGLFVIVEALNKTGLIDQLSTLLRYHSERSVSQTAWGSGISIALISNLVNNLPSGLIAGSALQITPVSEIIRSSILIGVDLGPNLSVTGSLATILWLVTLRREGQDISAWSFLKIGSLVMTIALLCALGALWIA